MLDRLGSNRFLVPHVVQVLPPTMKSGDPVSKRAVKFCGGVPMLKVVYHYEGLSDYCTAYMCEESNHELLTWLSVLLNQSLYIY